MGVNGISSTDDYDTCSGCCSKSAKRPAWLAFADRRGLHSKVRMPNVSANCAGQMY